MFGDASARFSGFLQRFQTRDNVGITCHGGLCRLESSSTDVGTRLIEHAGNSLALLMRVPSTELGS